MEKSRLPITYGDAVGVIWAAMKSAGLNIEK